MTSHWPNKAKLFPVFPQIYGKPIKKIKDINIEQVNKYINENGLKLI